MLEKFELSHRTHLVGLYSGTMAQDLAALAPARLVPALRTPDGTIVGESVAMAETLAERHPTAGLWPADPASRATARWLVAEMASGFSALRGECPMQLVRCWAGFEASDQVLGDLDRLETVWRHARAVSGSEQNYLFGDYCLADVFFTPVAARIIGYGLPVSDHAQAYCAALLDDPAVKVWRDAALKVTYSPEPYLQDLPHTPWPFA